MVAADVPGSGEQLMVPVEDAPVAAESIAARNGRTALRLRLAMNARSLVERKLSACEIGRQIVEIYRALSH